MSWHKVSSSEFNEADDGESFFPIFFKEQKKIVYLDSAATSLKPQVVIQAINDYNQKYSINSHSESSSPL